MDRTTLHKWLNKPRAVCPAVPGTQRVLFFDNAFGHNETEAMISSLNCLRHVLQNYPSNAIYLIQPLDNFLLREVKKLWKAIWSHENRGHIEQINFRIDSE